MTQRRQQLTDAFQSRTFLKVISGIANFDARQAVEMAEAGHIGGAQAIDVAADPALIREVRRQFPDLLLFVSSLEPEKLATAAELGADVLELGNFDSLYRLGMTMSAEDALDLTRRVRRLLPAGALLCATVPGRLPAERQLQAAVQLQAAGADILQTEGSAGPSLEVAGSIVQAVEVPVFASGGITLERIPSVMRTGTRGIGVGRVIRAMGDVTGMADMVREFKLALEKVTTSLVK